jgi:RHS repeat-associated protein
MMTRRGLRHQIIQFFLSQAIFCISFSVNAQFQWEFAGKHYPSRSAAEAALKAHPAPQYLQFAEPWYEEILWRDPATTLFWYTLFDYQAAENVQFAGYTVSKHCGFFDGTDCNATIQEAVDSSHPNPTAALCDVKFEVMGEFEFRQQQWEEVLEHGIRFWASESAPIRIDFYHTNLNTGNCDYGSSVNQTLRKVSLATCEHDLSPISGSSTIWTNPPDFPNVCSPSGREPPISNMAKISKRLTSVCTVTEGNPCSPMTGNKSHTETDFMAGAIEFTRYYNSSLELGSNPMGKGWSHSYDTRLISSGGYSLVKPDGNVEEFSNASGDRYRSITTPGKILVVANDLAQLTYPGGRKEIFELAPSPAVGPQHFRLIEIYTADLPDRAVALSYSGPAGLLDSITGPFGRQLRIEYELDGYINTLMLPDGKRIQYLRDAGENLSEVIFQDGGNRVYLYEDSHFPNHLTGIIDENGARFATYQYDGFGRVTLSEHSGGANRVSLDYVDAGTTEVTGPLGNIRRYDFDPNKPSFDVSDVNDTDGTTIYTRNPDGWPIEKKDAAGHLMQSTYDEFHETRRVEAYGTPDQRTINYNWDNGLNRKIRVEEPGMTTYFAYDSLGRIQSKSIEDSSSGSIRSWNHHYYPDTDLPPRAGRLQSIDGPRTDVEDITTYYYYLTDDASGRYRAGDLQSIHNAEGHITEFLEYDGNGRLTKIRDANGVINSFSYHPRGWPASVSFDGVKTLFTYDNVGNLIRTISHDGSHVDFRYDAAHRLTGITDSQGNRIEYTLDPDGNRIEENTFDHNNALRRQLSRTFSSVGRLEQLIDSTGHSISYTHDGNGSLISTRDENLHSTIYEYDALDRLARSVDPLMGETFMAYDARDNLIRVTDPQGNVTDYQYDGLDNAVSMSSPDTGISHHEFDNAGNRVASIDARGVRIEYRYDALNRLTHIIYPDSSKDVSYSYDEGANGKGRLTGMSDGAGTVNFTYDSRGNLLSENRWINDHQYQTKYFYDAADRLVGLEYPSGKIISYKLDESGRISGIRTGPQTLVSNVRYEPFGPANFFTYGNGLEYTAVFNLDQELTRLESGAGVNLDLEYGPAGSILSINDQTFAYDPLYRLIASSGDQDFLGIDYDANDNRLHYQDMAINHSYTYESNSNRLETAGEWSYARDGAGNRMAKLNQAGDGQLYRFGDHNRMAEVIDRNAGADIPAGEYLYDGKGRRIAKTVSGNEIHFIYNPSGQLVGEYSTGGDGEYREYIYLESLPVAVLARSAETVTPPGAELILDNGDQGTTATGNWRSKTSREDFGSDYLYAAKSASTSYRWTATPPGDQYRVYAWWVDRKNQSGNVSYTIRHGSGEQDTVTRSQKTGGGQWQLLGSYSSEDGQDFVEISSESNKFTADAIRWVSVNEPVVTITDSTHFIHFDHLGTPSRVTDENQSVVWAWDSIPFGSTQPDENPDGDSNRFVLNLRFPGQYYDSETGLHYNFFRTYDPEIGRYLESDPIGLQGGLNTYGYAGQNPLKLFDPFGLAVTGDWIQQPRLNIRDYRLTGAEMISPYLDAWGFLKVIRVHGYASGYINLDVKCSDSDSCLDNEWEVHEQIDVSYRGYKDFGPNMIASGAGTAAGPLAGVATGIVTIGGSALTSLLGLLKDVQAHGGEKIQWLYEIGPTAICHGIRQ